MFSKHAVIFTLCMLDNFTFLCLLIFLFIYFFQNEFFRKLLSGILSVYQTAWIGTGLVPNCLQRLSVDGTIRPGVNLIVRFLVSLRLSYEINMISLALSSLYRLYIL